MPTMHKAALLLLLSFMIIGTAYLARVSVPLTLGNPDPNHTHADFAVWIGGEKLDFSGEEFMSGSSAEETDDEHGHEHRHAYLHLHDGNGDVIHRHKPGLTFGEFMASLGLAVASGAPEQNCLYRMRDDRPFAGCESDQLRLFANDREIAMLYASDVDYPFQDGDRILLTDASDDAEIRKELALLTRDACLYSRTCRWRGAPPAESCVADPQVPCTE